MSGQTVVDPKGYLTDLNSITPQSTGDIKLVESLNYQQVGFIYDYDWGVFPLSFHVQ